MSCRGHLGHEVYRGLVRVRAVQVLSVITLRDEGSQRRISLRLYAREQFMDGCGHRHYHYRLARQGFSRRADLPYPGGSFSFLGHTSPGRIARRDDRDGHGDHGSAHHMSGKNDEYAREG